MTGTNQKNDADVFSILSASFFSTNKQARGCSGKYRYSPLLFSKSLLLSRLCFSFDVILQEKVLTVEHGIGELTDPVAQNQHPAVPVQHQIELNVTMAKDKVVDIGVRLQIFLGIHHQIFLILAHIRRFSSLALMLHAAVFGPREPKLHAPTRMQG